MRYGLMFGPSFLFLLLVPFLGLALWAVMDALIRPDSHWAAADQNKIAWVLGLLAGPVVLFPVGIMVSLVYLLGIRSRLTRVAGGYTPTVRVPPE
jgi:hypothetical protein